MNTREYLDRYSRITADNVEATIEARNDDGTYLVRTIGTRAILRASPANPVDTFALNSRVIVSQPGATRGSIGAQRVILSRSPRDQRGLSGSTPAESSDSIPAPSAIISIDPDPLVLIAGGEPGVQTITGINLGEAATYAGDDGMTSPNLTEDDPPTTSATVVVMSFSADADSLLGDWNVSINGATAKNALRITEPDPVGPSLWALAYVDPGFVPHLLKLDVDTYEVLADNTISESSISDLVAIGDDIVVKSFEFVTRFDRVSGTPDTPAAASQTVDSLTVGQTDGNLYYGEYYAGGALLVFDVAPGSESSHALDTTDAEIFSVAVDATHAWIATGDHLIRVDLAGLTESGAVAVTVGKSVTVDDDGVYIMRRHSAILAETIVEKYDKAALTVSGAIEVAPLPDSFSAYTQIRASGGYIYGTVGQSGGGLAFRFAAATMDGLVTVEIADGPAGFGLSGTMMYVGDFAGGINVIDLADFSFVARTQLACLEIDRLIVA